MSSTYVMMGYNAICQDYHYYNEIQSDSQYTIPRNCNRTIYNTIDESVMLSRNQFSSENTEIKLYNIFVID